MSTATISASLVFTNAGNQVALSVGSLSITVAGTHYIHQVQTVTITTPQALAMGGVTAAGYGVFINRSDTNTITIGKTGAADIVSLLPGEVAAFRLGVNAPYAVSITGSADLEYLIVST